MSPSVVLVMERREGEGEYRLLWPRGEEGPPLQCMGRVSGLTTSYLQPAVSWG